MKYEFVSEVEKEKRERILEAVNYLLRKNPDIVYLDGILYDRKEKKYYDCETGEILNG